MVCGLASSSGVKHDVVGKLEKGMADE